MAEIRAAGQFLFYFGINKPHKNLPALIDAYAQWRTASAYPLVIAGAWDERYPEAKQAAAQKNLGDSVIFLGPIPDADLPALYAAATAFIFPSRYEGFGLPVLEAMACGTPVACSNTSSLPEVAGDAALLFAPDDINAIAGALTQLTDSSTRLRLRERGLQQAARFTWRRTAEQTLAVYRSLAVKT
ncbi:MAG: glycosyltransferase family 1 protein [Caldilineaceae bacterium]